MRVRVLFQKRTPEGGRRQLAVREFEATSFTEVVQWALDTLKKSGPETLKLVAGLKIQVVNPVPALPPSQSRSGIPPFPPPPPTTAAPKPK
jgi:hypothetical protein